MATYHVCSHEKKRCDGKNELKIAVPDPDEDGHDKEFEWEFEDMVPDQAFCNWQVDVEGFDPKSNDELESALAAFQVTIDLWSATGSDYALVSAANSNFVFSSESKRKGKYEPINLLRFAELQPRIVVAQDSRNSTKPMDLSITMHVERQAAPDGYSTANSSAASVQADGSSLIFIIGLSAGLGVVLVCLIVMIILTRRKSHRYATPHRSRRKSALCQKLANIRCRCKCRLCRRRMPKPLTSFRNTERQNLADEIEKSAIDQ